MNLKQLALAQENVAYFGDRFRLEYLAEYKENLSRAAQEYDVYFWTARFAANHYDLEQFSPRVDDEQ